MSIIHHGLIRERVLKSDIVENPALESLPIVKINETTFFIGTEAHVVFKGIIRGGEYPMITYIGPSVESVTYGLALDEWIYRITTI